MSTSQVKKGETVVNKLHVKKGDNVVVLSGKDKGKMGTIQACNIKDSRVLVEGVNLITRHVKPRSAQNAGGRIPDFGFIHSSNVQIICPECSKPTRIGKKEINGVKTRVCKHCDASLDVTKTDKKAKKGKEAKVEKKKEKPVKAEKVAKVEKADAKPAKAEKEAKAKKADKKDSKK